MSENVLLKYAKPETNKAPDTLFDEFCKSHKCKIPKDFNEFYRQSNGVCIEDEDFEFVFEFEEPFWNRKELRFVRLLEADDIFYGFREGEGVTFPVGTLPFVDIELANICISCREDSFGQIFFVEKDPTSEQMKENASEEAITNFAPSHRKLPDIMCKLADTFEEFVAKLKVEEWD